MPYYIAYQTNLERHRFEHAPCPRCIGNSECFFFAITNSLSGVETYEPCQAVRLRCSLAGLSCTSSLVELKTEVLPVNF